MTELKKTLSVFLERVWGQSDLESLAEMIADDAKIGGLEEIDLDGPAAFAAFHRMIHAQFRDIRVIVENMVEEGDWIATRIMLKGVDRKSARAVNTQVHVMCKFVDGLLVEGYNLVDFLSLFQQTGLLPDRTLDVCLMGHRPSILQGRPRATLRAV